MIRVPTEADLAVYAGKSVLVTGHTGFKGGWLTHWLAELGARVTGYALPPDVPTPFFDAAEVQRACRHVAADLRDLARLREVVREARPDHVFHLAAQPLVRRSYAEPLETLQTNVLGTANLLEAIRQERVACTVVVVTSDKCYENTEQLYGYRETDPMGGHDIYSMSKGAAELVVSSYRRSFFPPQALATHGVALASARAGNVIGGGDWASDRLLPDCIRALRASSPIQLRNPDAVRPWQHVLDPLSGYLLLGARLAQGGAPERARFCEAWNFGPRPEDSRQVQELAQGIIDAWGSGRWVDARTPDAPHEAHILRLSIEKAQLRLGWSPRWSFQESVEMTVAWYRAQARGESTAALKQLTLQQIRKYLSA